MRAGAVEVSQIELHANTPFVGLGGLVWYLSFINVLKQGVCLGKPKSTMPPGAVLARAKRPASAGACQYMAK
jgi:hypothetical protein